MNYLTEFVGQYRVFLPACLQLLFFSSKRKRFCDIFFVRFMNFETKTRSSVLYFGVKIAANCSISWK